MRDLYKNTQLVHYAVYSTKEEVTADGKRTGQYTPTYADPVAVRVPISVVRGEAELELFGTDVQYSRTISTTKNLPLTEQSLVWIDSPTTSPADYRVVRVAHGLHNHYYALTEAKP